MVRVQVLVQITKVIYIKIYKELPPEVAISGKQLVKNFVKYVIDRTNWDRQSLLEVGWLETIEVGKIGKIRAKMDTGNEFTIVQCTTKILR